jgi:hypothetical protein
VKEEILVLSNTPIKKKAVNFLSITRAELQITTFFFQRTNDILKLGLKHTNDIQQLEQTNGNNITRAGILVVWGVVPHRYISGSSHFKRTLSHESHVFLQNT